MSMIKSKKTLHSTIKWIIEGAHEEYSSFPQKLTFCEGMGHPTFTFTIEKREDDFFVDDKGQRWVKAD